MPIKFLLESVINVLNVSDFVVPLWMADMYNLLGKALMFFPTEVYVVTLMNIGFWITVQFAWAIIEWIYKKIPGIN